MAVLAFLVTVAIIVLVIYLIMVNVIHPSIHMVEFQNGKYGIRRYDYTDFEWEYLDLTTGINWLSIDNTQFNRCLSDKETVAVIYTRMTDKGKIVK